MLNLRTIAVSTTLLISPLQSTPFDVVITSEKSDRNASVVIIDRSRVLRSATDATQQLPESLTVKLPAKFLLLKKDAVVNVRSLVESDRTTVTIDDNRSLHMVATSASVLIEQLEKRISVRGSKL